jgi:hypothetical protein
MQRTVTDNWEAWLLLNGWPTETPLTFESVCKFARKYATSGRCSICCGDPDSVTPKCVCEDGSSEGEIRGIRLLAITLQERVADLEETIRRLEAKVGDDR